MNAPTPIYNDAIERALSAVSPDIGSRFVHRRGSASDPFPCVD